ncbi:MAG: nicotinamide riboside transporter PnuC [Puniceicoccaceae bacterium]|nr:MAG: nicotinamide riboside transporter PnuC [Puniceicoccaceae bacterium]
MATGIAGVWLSIKEKILAWPFFIICYGCYIYISYQFGLPALMGMNVVFIGLSLYGWAKWSNPKGSVPAVQVSRTPRLHWPLVAGFICVGTVGVGWLLTHYDGATQPYFDAFATCCGFTAQWMLGRKYIETWLFWIISDIIYLVIFALGGFWPTVLLFAVFTVLAIKGWSDWKQQSVLTDSSH